jgi:hypothetical protein
MTTFAFDLISDLHIETWDDFDWTGQPTAPYCVVAGDVARDPQVVADVLTHLGQQYLGVFYIDGNDEHRHSLNDIAGSYRDLEETIKGIKNVVYLQNHVVIINGVALLATNGWWSYDFDTSIDMRDTMDWYSERYQLQTGMDAVIHDIAVHDAAYFRSSIHRLQTHRDVKAIALITHTVPAPWIIEHDIDLVDSYRFNGMGNSHMERVYEADTENKIRTWCFGHYHKSVDRLQHGIRYVNNCRGRGDTQWAQAAYYPKRIEIEV